MEQQVVGNNFSNRVQKYGTTSNEQGLLFQPQVRHRVVFLGALVVVLGANAHLPAVGVKTGNIAVDDSDSCKAIG